jgi:Flp pilus assembly CpaF family ATPase
LLSNATRAATLRDFTNVVMNYLVDGTEGEAKTTVGSCTG